MVHISPDRTPVTSDRAGPDQEYLSIVYLSLYTFHLQRIISFFLPVSMGYGQKNADNITS